jgi:hypothetical protein
MSSLRWRIVATVAAIACVFAVSTAKAETIHLVGLGGGGTNTVTFQVTLDASGELVTGTNNQTTLGGNADFYSSFVTLYDIPNFVSASYSPDVAAATFGTQTSGTAVLPDGVTTNSLTPRNPNAAGNPAVTVTDGADTNVTLVYNGASGLTISSLSTTAINGDKLLGILTVNLSSPLAGGKLLGYAMQDNSFPGHSDEALVSAVSVAVPTPATAGLGILLLGGLGTLGGRRRFIAA